MRSGREVDEELAIVIPVVKKDLHIEQKTVGGVVGSQRPQGDRGQAQVDEGGLQRRPADLSNLGQGAFLGRQNQASLSTLCYKVNK